MAKKYGGIGGILLGAIGEATGFFSWPIEGTLTWRRKQIMQERPKKIYDNLYHLKKKGLIKEISKNGKRFFELTKKGEMQELLIKASINPIKKEAWDGKWRLAIFDIPEEAREKRDKLRRLLKENGFIKLQASVFINPYPLNRSAVLYLKQSGLIEFIRLARIDDLDDDSDLKKKFKLN
jgi:DNA-binding transcriptional regulator PaaX